MMHGKAFAQKSLTFCAFAVLSRYHLNSCFGPSAPTISQWASNPTWGILARFKLGSIIITALRGTIVASSPVARYFPRLSMKHICTISASKLNWLNVHRIVFAIMNWRRCVCLWAWPNLIHAPDHERSSALARTELRSFSMGRNNGVCLFTPFTGFCDASLFQFCSTPFPIKAPLALSGTESFSMRPVFRNNDLRVAIFTVFNNALRLFLHNVIISARRQFVKAGTVGLVADRLQRDAILIELSPTYAEMARERIQSESPMFTVVT